MGCGASHPIIPRASYASFADAHDTAKLRISQDGCFLSPMSNRPNGISIVSFSADGQDAGCDSNTSISLSSAVAIPRSTTGIPLSEYNVRESIVSSVRPSCEIVAPIRVSQKPRASSRRLSVLSCRSINSMGGCSEMSTCSMLSQKTARAESFSESSDDESAASDESLFAAAQANDEDPVDVDDELYFLDVTDRNSKSKNHQQAPPRVSMDRYDEEIDLDAEIALSSEKQLAAVDLPVSLTKFEYLPETSVNSKRGKKKGKGKRKVKCRKRGKSMRKRKKSKSKKLKKTFSAMSKRGKKPTRKTNCPRKVRKPRQAQKLLKRLPTLSNSRRSVASAEAMNWI